MSEISEKMRQYTDSEIGKSVRTLIAYTIRKTETLKDDEILDNVAEIKDVIAEVIASIAEVTPTDKDAKTAALVILTNVAALTKTKWDDRLIPIIKLFL